MYIQGGSRSASRDFLAHNLNKGKLGTEKRKSLKKKKSITGQDGATTEKKKSKKAKQNKTAKKNELLASPVKSELDHESPPLKME